MKRFIYVFISVFIVSISSLPAIDLSRLSIYEDKSKSPSKRIAIIYGILLEEVYHPTSEHRGWGGGIINHDYTMAQIIGAMGCVVRESADAKVILQKKISTEENTELKEAITVAMALGGDKSVNIDELLCLLKRNNNNFRREKVAYAISEIGSVIIIPDLIDALHDNGSELSCLEDSGKRFPVRGAAAYGLKKMNIPIKKSNNMSFEVDKDSAVKAIEPALFNGDEKLSSQSIKSIKRIGGTYAQKVLEKYITAHATNSTNSTKKALVDEAKNSLS